MFMYIHVIEEFRAVSEITGLETQTEKEAGASAKAHLQGRVGDDVAFALVSLFP
jgi:hypothetical protein